MLNELKILFKNIRNLRKPILNEGVNEKNIIDAINNHKIVYIYYAGDDTILKGYRTIRPFVIGNHKSTGNKVLRAWQDAGSSDSFRGLNREPRQGHEKINGPKGVQPGWRLFLVDSITSLMPTGEEFNPRDYFSIGSIKYNPDDKAMSNIDAYISVTPEQGIKKSGGDSYDDPNVISKKTKDTTFDTQGKNFKQFFKSTEKNRQPTKEEIENLWEIVKKYKKKSPKKYWVIQNEKGDMVLATDNAINNNRVDPKSIIGNLRDLYNRIIVEPKQVSDDFFKKNKKNP